jgi:ribosomal protein S18 acetylase RimI-like enzyme
LQIENWFHGEIPMNIRPFQPSDLRLLKAITVEAFTGVSIDHGIEEQFGPIHGHDWKWRKARHIDKDVARDPAGVFVAEDNGRVVGYISTWQDREAGIGHIPNIAIAPEYRGQGLGRLLIEHALAHFRASGLTHAKIETLAQNAIGNHLYRDLGFVEVARQVHFVAKL